VREVADPYLQHGFDSTGRLYNQHSKLEEWWSKSTGEAYRSRQNCLAQQYSRRSRHSSSPTSTHRVSGYYVKDAHGNKVYVNVCRAPSLVVRFTDRKFSGQLVRRLWHRVLMTLSANVSCALQHVCGEHRRLGPHPRLPRVEGPVRGLTPGRLGVRSSRSVILEVSGLSLAR
jgi:hypothetical protein